jgi:hypothetical protein
MNQLPKIARARLQALSAGAHPDPDVLTAFFEQVLPEDERHPVLAHLATCAECRLAMALALPDVAADGARVHVVSSPAVTWGWSGLMRWGSVVACLVVVGAAVMIHKPTPAALRSGSDADTPLSQKISQNDTTQPAAPNKTANNEGSISPQTAPALTSQATSPHVDATEAARAGKRFESVPAPRRQAQAGATAAKIAVPTERSSDIVTSQPATQSRPAGAVGGLIARNRQTPANVPAAGAAPGLLEAQVTTEPLSSSKETPGRAKAATPNPSGSAATPEQSVPVLAGSFRASDQTTPAGNPATIATLPAKWILSDEGQLQRSFDGGKNWEPVPVVERAKFTALSAAGLDIWVGGPAGVLYHSANNGLQWTLVKPTAEGVALAEDIVSVDFTDLQHGVVTTNTSQKWTTADGGSHWRVGP